MSSPTIKAMPPSPPESFIGGHLLSYRRDTLGFMLKNAREQGDVVQLNFMENPAIQLNHPDDIQIVLTKKASLFHKSWIYKTTLSEYLGNGLLISDGDFWKRQRKLAQPAFHTQRISSYATIMSDYTTRMLEDWQVGETRNIAEDMMELTLYIVAKTLFDADVRGDSNKVAEALEVLLQVVIEASKTIVKLPSWIPTPMRMRKKWSIDTLNEVVNRVISERRASGEDTGDLMSMLLLAQDDDGTGMTDEQIRNETLTIFLAGHETTANAMTWLFYLLSQNPDAEVRLHDEVDRVLNGRTPTLEDLKDLTYTEQVIKEALRLYPPAWSFARQPIEDVEIRDYTIPQWTTTMIVPYVLHRDERWFSNPLQFDPDRWTPEREKEVPRYAYLPFGGGPRVCIGNGFAMMEAQLILAGIAQHYKLKLAPNQTIEPEALITLRPKNGMHMILEAR